VVAPVSWTAVTPGSRAIMPGAAPASSAMPPLRSWPSWTVSRLVPRALISAISPSWEEADRPSTATMAATPIVMPSADSAARSRRVARPRARVDLTVPRLMPIALAISASDRSA
jgi:hypothetical protein